MIKKYNMNRVLFVSSGQVFSSFVFWGVVAVVFVVVRVFGGPAGSIVASRCFGFDSFGVKFAKSTN